MKIINRDLCVKCKGRGWCGLKKCPLIEKAYLRVKVKKDVSKKLEGESPGVFVSRFNYPNISFGALVGDNTNIKDWLKYGFSIEKILERRLKLINTWEKQKELEKIQEIALSKKAPYIHAILKKKPNLKFLFSPEITPFGGSAPLKNLEVDDLKINYKIEKIVRDELKAEDSVIELYKKGIDEIKISEVFSVGLLGINKKLVPTRWSITATDDIIGKKLIKKIKEYPLINNYLVWEGGLYGNLFTILMIPKKWSYELFEIHKGGIWVSGKVRWVRDYEFYWGRKTYAENCSGGYYAARLPILEKLNEIKRQALVIAIREITSEYWAPLGVWVVREAVRNAMKKYKKFESLGEAVDYVKNKTGFEFDKYSILLKQSNLNQFLSQ